MAELPVLPPGTTITVAERWHGLPWSAEPQRVVRSDPATLLSWMPAGAVAVRASSRGLPGTETMSREQRKLAAMEQRRARPIESVETPEKLYVHRAGRWSRVSLGWSPTDGRFLGWYVNFEQPLVAEPDRAELLWGKDLVLDIWVDADRGWRWKDADDFELAVDRGIIDAGLRATFAHETELVLAELETRTGPFDPSLLELDRGPDWPVPVLPADFALAAPRWSVLTEPA